MAQQVAPGKIGRIRLSRIADAAMMTIHEALEEAIELGSVVRTDGWNGYNNLETIGYEHLIVRKDASIGGDPLPLVGRVASLLKRWLIGTHQGAPRSSHLDYYLDEFTFRFNRRSSGSGGLLFYRLLEQAVAVGPWTEADIRGGFAVS